MILERERECPNYRPQNNFRQTIQQSGLLIKDFSRVNAPHFGVIGDAIDCQHVGRGSGVH